MIRLHMQSQIVFGLILALLWGVLSIFFNTTFFVNRLVFEPEDSEEEQFLPTETSQTSGLQPFTTLPDLMMVRVRIKQEASPEIVSVIPLPQGRLSVSDRGNSTLRLVSENNQILFEIKFTPNFFFGDPPFEHDSVEMIFVLPTIVEAVQLELLTPFGNEYHELK